MIELTTNERVKRMFEHRQADRIPVAEIPWDSTVERWRREGMPADVGYTDYFGLDPMPLVGVDISPRFPERTIEETDAYRIYTTPWGVTQRNWKHAASTPEFLDFTVTDPDSWRQARERMTPTRDRINWEYLRLNYPLWRKQGAWIQGLFWFGFDATHSWFIGTERTLMALRQDPEWCVEMFTHELEMCIALFDMLWEAGYPFDAIYWPDDMGFKHSQFFSVETYRELIKPLHRRAIEWAHAKGIKALLHSCGDVNPFVPELIEIGLDGLNPLEVKAGMDPAQLKRRFGDRLLFHGGVNAVLWDDLTAITEEMRRVLPVMKEQGGYIFSSDHSVPDAVSLESFRAIVTLAKELGRY